MLEQKAALVPNREHSKLLPLLLRSDIDNGIHECVEVAPYSISHIAGNETCWPFVKGRIQWFNSFGRTHRQRTEYGQGLIVTLAAAKSSSLAATGACDEHSSGFVQNDAASHPETWFVLCPSDVLKISLPRFERRTGVGVEFANALAFHSDDLLIFTALTHRSKVSRMVP